MRKIRLAIMSFLMVIAAAIWVAPSAQASIVGGGGRNQLGYRLSFRLDQHTGQGAGNESGPFRLYWDSGCTSEAPAWRYRGSQAWAVLWPETDNGYSTMVTIPIITVDSSGTDAGLHYTTYWGKNSDLAYIISGTGHFNGADWDENTWWNRLPSSISYTSVHPGDVEKTYVGNNVGGFSTSGPDGNGYYSLYTGDYSTWVMNGYLTQYTYYDTDHSDRVNAVYQWNENDRPWTTDGLHQGTNTVYFAGMDWSGNFATGQRILRYDTIAPNLSNTIMSINHNGWLNAQIVANDGYSISARDDTSQTSDVSGVHSSSLQFAYDSGGYSGYNYTTDPDATGTTVYYGSYSNLAAQFGQGIHTLNYSMFDWAGNYGYSSQQVNIDTVPPTCTSSAGTSDWHIGTQPITLTYSDSTSGVATKQYSWSQSQTQAGTWQDYTGQQLAPPGDGQWYLHWQSTDVAGNSSSGVFGAYSRDADLSVKIQTPNANYLTGEDVVTSAVVFNGSATPVLPGDSAVLHFTVYNPDGSVFTSQSKTIVDPASDSNIIWFRWHTPSPGTYRMTANITAAGVTPRAKWTDTLSWEVKAATENAPPQTGLWDTKPSWFTTQSPPSSGYSRALSWSDWTYNGGFVRRTYTATLNANLSVTPTQDTDGSNRIVTATQDGTGLWTMKSGYGISEKVSSGVALTSSTGSAIDSNSTTPAQLTEGRYPEFGYYYAGYFRLFDLLGNGSFQLRQNPYSQYGFRTHYIPVWYPDGVYTALATASQAWSPAGMLGVDSTGIVNISGALPQDWYVRFYPYQ